jgi:hypothetical protein
LTGCEGRPPSITATSQVPGSYRLPPSDMARCGEFGSVSEKENSDEFP